MLQQNIHSSENDPPPLLRRPRFENMESSSTHFVSTSSRERRRARDGSSGGARLRGLGETGFLRLPPSARGLRIGIGR